MQTASIHWRALCVSVHDVAPATWSDCQRVIAAVQTVAPIPLTLLVVPYWHRLPQTGAREYEAGLSALQAAGHELALHGYTHLDEGPAPRHWSERFRRRVLTRSEGEFAALDNHAAQQRLQAGLAWFAERCWPLTGFVAPAWMMSAAARAALSTLPFTYTTDYGGLVLLPQFQRLRAPALVYSTRQRCGDALIRGAMSMLAAAQAQAPVLRIALHPADVRRPANLRHAQRLIAQALREREALTKAGLADRLRMINF
jgi:predicted deacetylase